MNKSKPIPAGILVLYAIMLAPVLMPIMIGVPIVGGIISSAVGAIVILSIVRWTNRRTDVRAIRSARRDADRP